MGSPEPARGVVRATLEIDPGNHRGTIDRRLFGSFIEHLGRAVYDGLYEPAHPLADECGFRQDVLDLVRELGVTTVRYPGGNFVSSYRWEDGVGPREERPRRVDLAWHSLETNEIGLNEFAAWCRRADVELMLAVNLGTRGIEAAVDLLEYSNVRSGTTLSDLRASHGASNPHNVRMWCLGNEIDGPWQVGTTDAASYGRLAMQTARAMRRLDQDLELVVCGSSGPHMPTFGDWERTVLRETYEVVDYISCHVYYEETDGDRVSFLAAGAGMAAFIEAVVAAADEVQAELQQEKAMQISFDEWNVWYSSRFHAEDEITDADEWPVAPRLLEDSYSVVDAVVVGGLLITLLNHSDRVRAASLAQLVNVIAPIMTEPGGISWRQTTFFPFADAAQHAESTSLRVHCNAPTMETAKYGNVSVIDAAATRDELTGVTTLFMVNRTEEPVEVAVPCGALQATQVSAHGIWDADPSAANTLDDPERVGRRSLDAKFDSGTREVRLTLPPISWVVVRLETESGQVAATA